MMWVAAPLQLSLSGYTYSTVDPGAPTPVGIGSIGMGGGCGRATRTGGGSCGEGKRSLDDGGGDDGDGGGGDGGGESGSSGGGGEGEGGGAGTCVVGLPEHEPQETNGSYSEQMGRVCGHMMRVAPVVVQKLTSA